MGRQWHAVAALCISCTVMAAAVGADRGRLFASTAAAPEPEDVSFLRKVASYMWQKDGTTYHHVWPVMIGNLCCVNYSNLELDFRGVYLVKLDYSGFQAS